MKYLFVPFIILTAVASLLKVEAATFGVSRPSDSADAGSCSYEIGELLASAREGERIFNPFEEASEIERASDVEAIIVRGLKKAGLDNARARSVLESLKPFGIYIRLREDGEGGSIEEIYLRTEESAPFTNLENVANNLARRDQLQVAEGSGVSSSDREPRKGQEVHPFVAGQEVDKDLQEYVMGELFQPVQRYFPKKWSRIFELLAPHVVVVIKEAKPVEAFVRGRAMDIRRSILDLRIKSGFLGGLADTKKDGAQKIAEAILGWKADAPTPRASTASPKRRDTRGGKRVWTSRRPIS